MTADERKVAWDRGLWVALFDARVSRLEGPRPRASLRAWYAKCIWICPGRSSDAVVGSRPAIAVEFPRTTRRTRELYRHLDRGNRRASPRPGRLPDVGRWCTRAPGHS